MREMKKALLAGIILILLVPLVARVYVSAAVSKPSVPEFTLKFVDKSYYTPATTKSTIDPYTNETSTTNIPSCHVENLTIELTIENQPLIYGENYTIYFNIREKGHFEENWTEHYDSYSQNLPVQSNSAYTVLSILANNYPANAQIDFQAQAILGHHYQFYTQSTFFSGPYAGYGVAGISDWSNTQTITINPSTQSLTASLAESASALNYGNTINFTASVDGGVPPYTYAWYIDNQTAQTSASPYYSTNTQPVGSHHVYVQVTDANNDSATTLTVEFNVLPISSSSSISSTSPSSSPTQQPTMATTPFTHSTPSPNYTFIVIIVGVVLVIVAIAVALVYFKRIKK
jgi:hypothetical protein